VLAEALGWAVDPDGNPATDDGAHVVNFSLGGTQETQLLRMVTRLVTCDFAFEDEDDDEDEDEDEDKGKGKGTGKDQGDFKDPGFDDDRERCRQGGGAVVIAAAGNSGNDIERLYPAAEGVKGSLAVTASTIDRRIAPFGNFGGWIGVAAPGANIVSTVPGGGWGTWSGTSMAAPLAAGTAALVMTQPPKDGDPGRPVPRQWRAEDVVKRLTDRVEVLCGPSIKQVDAAAAVLDQPALDLKCP
jgi:thermitase